MTRDVRAQLKALDGLTRSRGWEIVNQVMRDEIVSAAMAIADSPNMSLDEINFRRGAIWAAKQMLAIPVRLQQKLEADLALSSPLRDEDDFPASGT